MVLKIVYWATTIIAAAMLLPDLIRFGSFKVCGAIRAAHPPATVSARYG